VRRSALLDVQVPMVVPSDPIPRSCRPDEAVAFASFIQRTALDNCVRGRARDYDPGEHQRIPFMATTLKLIGEKRFGIKERVPDICKKSFHAPG
jgi:hypothetical protein